MGTSASKPAREAARAATRRQYPHNPSPSTTSKPPASRTSPGPSATAATTAQHQQYLRQAQQQPQSPPIGPTYHSKERPSSVKSEAIDMDGRDPDFAASLRSIGPVIPNPTFSNSSTFNQPRSRSSQSTSTSTSTSTPTPTTPSPYTFKTKNPNEGKTEAPAPSSSTGTTSNTPTRPNPALTVIAARARLAEEAEKELESFGKRSHAGRQFLDAVTIKQMITMRDREGVRPEDIERHLRLRKGVMEVLGDKGVVGEVR